MYGWYAVPRWSVVIFAGIKTMSGAILAPLPPLVNRPGFKYNSDRENTPASHPAACHHRHLRGDRHAVRYLHPCLADPRRARPLQLYPATGRGPRPAGDGDGRL